MASIRRSTPPTRRFGAHDDESPMMVSSTGSRSGKRKPLGNRGSATATGLSRSPLKARTVVTASNNKQQRQNSTHNTSVVPRRPSIRTTPGTDKKQNLQAQEKTAATSVSHDKENQVNKRQPGRNDGKKDKTTTKSVLRTPNTATTTKRAPCASQSVAFTPATKPPPAAARTTSTPCNRGSGLNALRRSLRESITPPNQKQRKGTIVDPADTTLQSQHSSSISIQTSAFQATSSNRPHFTQQLPKTPKSMLKEQLDLSFDEEESMLLSPGAATILSFPMAASALPTCQTVEEEEAKNENNQIIFKESYELIADNATKTSEPKLLHTESQNRLNSENSIKPKSVDAMTKSVFSASRRDPRRELKRNKMRVQSQSKVTPVITTLSIETIEKDNSEQHPDYPPPHQTPYVIQDTSHYKPVTIEKSKFATPYSKQGNGVCMDLTTMFFSEQKTIRKCNKVGAPIKEPQETPKTAGSSDENLLVSTGMPGEDEWAERQCNTFAKWLNFTLDPNDPEESEEGQNEEAVTQDEFKSRSALRTLMLHQRMAKARVAASQVYQGEHMQKVRAVIQSEVQKGKLLIRADRDMYADLTLRKKIISLLFSYSTPWLRVGLETLFGETILPDVPTQFSPAKRNTHDYRKTSSYQLRVAMRDFIVNRVLSDSTVLAKYTKGRCKVPSGNFETRYRAEMRSLVLSRLFILFFFLDQAKKENVIDKSPRLFAKSAQVKSSREVLISFCRDFLASEGDITKHLSRVGLKVAYSQDPMDEINLRITNFAVDLRDGIRLAKLAEVLMGAKPKSLLSKLRIPAVSRLQKLHNVGIALQALKALPISEEIVAHHIVDGHRAMVLKLMWTIIAHYCFPATFDFSAVEEEIVLVKGKLRAREGTSEITSNATLSFMNEQSIDANSPQGKGRKLLLQWCQAVCALFGIEVNDFSTSFADGKALCYLMHYYHPTMVPLEEIRPTTKDNHLVARLSVDQARYNERTNSTLAHTKISELGGIPDLKPTIDTSMPPDEKCMMVYLCYACSRLLASRNEVQACTVIQSRYREHKARIIMAKQTHAALKICDYWKKHKENYYINQKHRFGSAIAKIEEWVLERQEQLQLLKARRLELEMTREATVLVQNQIRGFLARQKVILLSKQNLIAINMQRYFRKKRAIRTYNEMAKAQFSAIQLQSLWRGFQTRYALSIKVSSIIFIQAVMRGHSIRRQIHFERRACICIQRYWRGFLGELQFQMDLLDIVAVQNTWRRRKAIRSWKLRSHSVIAIQQAARRFIARCKYHNKRRAVEALLKDHGNATSIQRIVRGFIAYKKASQRRVRHIAAAKIQWKWRARTMEKQAIRERQAATCIQAHVRSIYNQKRFRACLCLVRLIQAVWRLRQRKRLHRLLVKLQSAARTYMCRKHFKIRQRALLILQCSFRCCHAKNLARRLEAERCFLVSTVVFCQSMIRQYLASRWYERVQRSTKSLQSLFRGFRVRRDIVQDHRAATLVQSYVRRHFAKKNSSHGIAAVVTVQSFWRSQREQLRYHMIVSKTKQIQAQIRGFMAREQAAQLKHSQILTIAVFRQGLALSQRSASAATRLQIWWRTLHHTKTTLVKMHISATIIQAAARRTIARKHRNDTLDCIIIIQGLWRATCLMHTFQMHRAKTIKIQSLARGFLAREKLQKKIQMEATIRAMQVHSKALRASLISSSQIIQSTWRSYHGRCQFLKTRQRIVIVQALTRRFLVEVHQEQVQKQITRIQAFARRKKQVQLYKTQKHSAYLIQSSFRLFRLRRDSISMQEKIILVQALLRGNNIRRMLREQRKSTLRLQSVYRGYRARKHLHMLHRSATIIQSSWRGFITVVTYQMDLIDAIVVQSQVRRWLARRAVMQRLRAIVRLQSVGRTLISLSHTEELREKKRKVQRANASAMTIQRLFRGFIGRVMVEREHAARQIQKCWRCYTVHVDFLICLLSTMAIQSTVRRFLAQQRYKSRVLAIVTVQKFVRGLLQRKAITEKVRCAILIQAQARKFLVQCRLSRKGKACIIIQSSWRRARVKDYIKLMNIAATDMQKIWRGYVANFEYNLFIFAILQVQHAVREFLAKKRLQRLEEERERLRRPLAALTIQAAFRNFLARNTFKRLRCQVTTIQALFRGRCVRSRRDRRTRLMLITAARLKEANLKATKAPNMKLGARTLAALHVLQTSSRLSEIMTAICTLELSTRFSRACCESFAHAKATDILLSLIRQCNRSLPHVELLSYIMLVLKNVARYDCFLTYVATTNCAEIFLDLVQMFRDKDAIFCISVALLERCVKFDEEIEDLCKSHENLKRLKGVIALTSKKLATSGSKRTALKGQSADARKYIPGALKLGAPDLKEGLHSLKRIISYIESRNYHDV